MKMIWKLCKTYLHPLFLAKFVWGMLYNNASYLTASTFGTGAWLAYKGHNYPGAFWISLFGIGGVFGILWAFEVVRSKSADAE